MGSIGVVMNGFGFVEALDKLGVERRLVTAGRNKGFLDPFSPSKPAEVAHMRSLLSSVASAVHRGRPRGARGPAGGRRGPVRRPHLERRAKPRDRPCRCARQRRPGRARCHRRAGHRELHAGAGRAQPLARALRRGGVARPRQSPRAGGRAGPVAALSGWPRRRFTRQAAVPATPSGSRPKPRSAWHRRMSGRPTSAVGSSPRMRSNSAMPRASLRNPPAQSCAGSALT